MGGRVRQVARGASLSVGLSVGASLVWLFAVPTSGSAVWSAPREQSTGQRDTTQQAPTAIPASEIVRRSDEAMRRLEQLRPVSTADPAIQRVREALPQTTEALTRLRTEYDLAQLGEMSSRELRDALRAFQRQEAQLQTANSNLERRLQGLGAAAEELRTIEARWRATQRSIREGDYPQGLLEPVSSVLARVDTVNRQVQTTLDSVAQLDSRVSAALASLREDIARIEAARADLTRRLFQRNTPPLWRAFEGEPVGVPFIQRVAQASDARRATLTDYFRQNGDRGILHAVLFGAVLAITLTLRRRSRSWSLDDESLRTAAEVLAKPISSAVLVGLIVTVWIYPRAPMVVYDLALLILLFPLIRLLADQIGSRIRTALFMLGGLYVLQLVRGLLPDDWVYGRLILALETGVALATVWWLVRWANAVTDTELGRLRRVVLALARAGLVVFGAALLLNVLGYTALASLLTETTLRSALVAVVLYTAAQVLNGVVAASFRTRVAQALNSVRFNVRLLTNRARTIVGIVGVVLWLWVTFRLFGLWNPFWSFLSWIMDRELAVGSVAISLGDVVAFGLSLWAAVLLSRLVRAVLERDVLARLELTRGLAASVSRLVNYVILGLGLLFAFAAAGIDLSSLTIVVGALGVGIGFGLQNVVNNFVSGLILIFERPIHVGDTIELENLIGTVKQIGIRASTVRTFDGAEVIVPNADLISGRLVNWTLSDRLRRIEVNIGVKYGTDPDRVLELLTGVVKGHAQVLNDPAPQALFMEHGDSSLNFLLRFWTPNFDNWWVIKSDITVAVNRALKEAGIEIPFPQRDLHLRSVDASIGLPGRTAAESGGEGEGGQTGKEERPDSRAPDDEDTA